MRVGRERGPSYQTLRHCSSWLLDVHAQEQCPACGYLYRSNMSVSGRKAQICVWILGSLGIILIIVGVVVLSVFPSIYRKKVHENLVLAEGKETFDKWKKTPIPVSFSLFTFNVTNPHEVETLGHRPILKEVGPFFFHQQRSKIVLGWDDENKTVTYEDIKSFIYVPELSADQEEKIYMLNMPLMGVMGVAKNLAFKNAALPIIVNLLNSYNESLFVYKTPRELLFGGYKVHILEDLTQMLGAFVTVPRVLPNNTFGFFYGKNNTGAGIFTVYTGEDDISKFSQIVTWNGKNFIEHWDNEYCRMINGTDGSQFAPPVTRHDSLYVYTAELCRSVHLDYYEDVYVKDILTYRFMSPPNLFGSVAENPDNKCYCTNEDLCEVSGVMDISKCRDGVSLVVSGPHFFKGHSSYSNDVEGMIPEAALHETYVDIEPTTGMVLRASRKLQINYMFESSQDFPQTANAPKKMLLPLIWIREEASVTDDIADVFISRVKAPVTIAKSVLTACIVLGVLWIVIAGIVTFYIVSKKKKAATNSKINYSSVPGKPEENGEKPEKEIPGMTDVVT